MANGNVLSIDEVVYGDVGYNQETKSKIMNSTYLDMKAVNTLNDTLREVTSNSERVYEEVTDINQKLSKTNSERLSNGATAQENIRNMINARTDMETLREKLENLSEADFEWTLKTYNDKLKALKRGIRLQLLREAADEINKAAENNSSKYIYSDCNGVSYEGLGYPFATEGSIASLSYYNYKDIRSEIESTDQGDVTRYTAKKYKYAYINYWAWIKWDIFPFNLGDDTVDELERKFITLSQTFPAIKIPYDKNDMS